MNVIAFWNDVLAQNAERISDYFHPDAVINWHCTNESFSVNEFVRANCEYPGEWAGSVERVEYAGQMIVTATRVYPTDHSSCFHVVSFFRMRDGLINALDEYWADDGEAPQWRKEMRIGCPIRMS